jgi:hypothetical protein
MDRTDKIFGIAALLISCCILIGGIFISTIPGIYLSLGLFSIIVGLNSLIGTILRISRKLESPSIYFFISNLLNIGALIIAIICLFLAIPIGSAGVPLIIGSILIIIGGGYTLVLFLLNIFFPPDEEHY